MKFKQVRVVNPTFDPRQCCRASARAPNPLRDRPPRWKIDEEGLQRAMDPRYSAELGSMFPKTPGLPDRSWSMVIDNGGNTKPIFFPTHEEAVAEARRLNKEHRMRSTTARERQLARRLARGESR